jgi:hypothetical protein
VLRTWGAGGLECRSGRQASAAVRGDSIKVIDHGVAEFVHSGQPLSRGTEFGLSLIIGILTPSRCRLSLRDAVNPLGSKGLPRFQPPGANGRKTAVADNRERLWSATDRADRRSGIATGASQSPDDESPNQAGPSSPHKSPRTALRRNRRTYARAAADSSADRTDGWRPSAGVRRRGPHRRLSIAFALAHRHGRSVVRRIDRVDPNSTGHQRLCSRSETIVG